MANILIPCLISATIVAGCIVYLIIARREELKHRAELSVKVRELFDLSTKIKEKNKEIQAETERHQHEDHETKTQGVVNRAKE